MRIETEYQVVYNVIRLPETNKLLNLKLASLILSLISSIHGINSEI